MLSATLALLLLTPIAALNVRLGVAPVVIHVTPEGGCAPDNYARLARVCASAAAGGAAAIIVRDPRAPRVAVIDGARAVAAALAGSDCAVLINGDAAEAAAAGATVGAHLTEARAADPAAERGALPLLGASAHSVEAALRGAEIGADYVVVGTMFPTKTHPGAIPAGPGLAAAVARAFATLENAPLLVGVGGVDATNAAELAGAGADGAAAIRSVSDAADPSAAVRAIRGALQIKT